MASVVPLRGGWDDQEDEVDDSYRPGRGELTDVGNAQRLVDAHGEDIRYVSLWRRWIVWDGTRWAEDEDGRVVEMMRNVALGIYGEAAKEIDPDRKASLAKWAGKSQDHHRITNAIRQAESIPGMPISSDQLDADRNLFNVRNGTLDLLTGDLRGHQRRDLITKMAPVEYDPSARAPRWATFLEQVTGGDDRLIAFLARAVGYCLTGDVGERVLFMPWGAGQNGKSVFLETVRAVLGGDYACSTPTATLMAKRDEGIPSDVARLRGVRFVAARETAEGRKLDVAVVKAMTGNDTITARHLYGRWFDFRPAFKLWLATNFKPVVPGDDQAIWDRIRLIPFTVRIPDDQVDLDLGTKLEAEAAGVLAWAVRGCMAWRRDGLAAPEPVREATARYRAEQDSLDEFIEECCDLGEHASARSRELYRAYVDWRGDAGERPVTETKFALLLSRRGFEKKATRGGKVWHGIGLGQTLVKAAGDGLASW